MAKKTKKQAEGLGDTIADITDFLKIDKLVKSITSAMGIEGCGCERRKDKLNEIFPYKKDEENKEQ